MSSGRVSPSSVPPSRSSRDTVLSAEPANHQQSPVVGEVLAGRVLLERSGQRAVDFGKAEPDLGMQELLQAFRADLSAARARRLRDPVRVQTKEVAALEVELGRAVRPAGEQRE